MKVIENRILNYIIHYVCVENKEFRIKTFAEDCDFNLGDVCDAYCKNRDFINSLWQINN